MTKLFLALSLGLVASVTQASQQIECSENYTYKVKGKILEATRTMSINVLSSNKATVTATDRGEIYLDSVKLSVKPQTHRSLSRSIYEGEADNGDYVKIVISSVQNPNREFEIFYEINQDAKDDKPYLVQAGCWIQE